jgi:hypothetical protein
MSTVSDEWEPTGVWDAVLIDVLLRLDHDRETVMTMSAQERIDTVAAARRDGRLDDKTIEMLTGMGVLAAEG